MSNYIASVFLGLDLIFLNVVCVAVLVSGFKLMKKMKSFLDMFGGGSNEIR